MTEYPTAASCDNAPLLCSISLALRQVAVLVGRLEKAMLRICISSYAGEDQTATLQDFDLILQSLGELAELTDKLGQVGLPTTSADQAAVVAQMRLAWLRQLMGEKSDQLPDNAPKISIF